MSHTNWHNSLRHALCHRLECTLDMCFHLLRHIQLCVCTQHTHAFTWTDKHMYTTTHSEICEYTYTHTHAHTHPAWDFCVILV